MDMRVISIGALAAHPLWGERQPVRTGHSTTTLIRAGDALILVDPGLPAQMLVPRLAERANVKPEQVTHVFLTSFRPETHRAISAFDQANWLIGSEEREQVGVLLAQRLKDLADSGPDDDRLIRALEADVAVLRRCAPAPDRLAEHVDLFPLHGVTPGLCGLLLAGQRQTTVVCGDAIATVEHLEAGQVLPMVVDASAALESFREATEIADLLVLGRDNLVPNPARGMF